MFNLKSFTVIDTETDGLWKPSKIHVICARNQDGDTEEFREILLDDRERDRFIDYIGSFDGVVGHNFLQYDYFRVFRRLLPDVLRSRTSDILDTLILSWLINYKRKGGHSLAAYGETTGTEKKGKDIQDWSKLTEEMVERCHSDTAINLGIVRKYQRFLEDPEWWPSLEMEHKIALICAEMKDNGFAFDYRAAERMFKKLRGEVQELDEAIQRAFPARYKPIREVQPTRTAKGTLNLKDFRWYGSNDLSVFTGGPFTRVELEEFNPGSPRQVVERLNEAGWRPKEKTKGHIDAAKARNTPKERLEEFSTYGWKINEENLKTLPVSAPEAAKSIGRRIVLRSRVSDLEEWLGLAELEHGEYKIHGSFNSIGAWTHRLSHAKPNLANVPVAKRSPKDNEFERYINDLNDEMRSLWRASKNHRLVGTDADGLQMRIFAHYVNDPELINALISGSKENQTDIHSVHQRKLGDPCKSRDAAKTFIYAWLLGAGNAKVGEILETTLSEAKVAVGNFIESYPGLAHLKETIIPRDASRGYFIGLDGRKVVCNSQHLMLAGYLQNGEAVIMKGACIEWQEKLIQERVPYKMVTWPHDEWQTEIPDDDEICAYVQKVQVESIQNQARKLQMNCPLEGTSSWGYNWKDTH